VAPKPGIRSDAPRKLRCTRTIKISQLSVPTARADDLKKFYRQIFAGERRAAVLKQSGH